VVVVAAAVRVEVAARLSWQQAGRWLRATRYSPRWAAALITS
jgi:hypothetical protein